MITTIKIDNIVFEQLKEKSHLAGFDSMTIYKSIALQLYKMWFANEDHSDKMSWIQFCRIVEEHYIQKNTIIKEDCAISFLNKENSETEIIIEVSDETDEMLDGMNEAALQFALYLSKNSWDTIVSDILPNSQKTVREKVNASAYYIKEECLHKNFLEKASFYSDKTALIWYENGCKREMSYELLKSNSLKAANMLIKNGVQKEQLVSVALPKGIDQVIAVLGVLLAGAAYVPVGVHQPLERKKKIINNGNIKYVLTNKKEIDGFKEIENIKIMQIEDIYEFDELDNPVFPSVNSAAYVIFTSGTTGVPKGVIISHKGANNTIQDMFNKFSITDCDTGIAVSELDFDLSVFDIFGLLSIGGTLVILNEENKKEPEAWKKTILENNVTIWNTVPAIFDMLLTSCEINDSKLPLKKVLLSGDWINMNLFPRMKELTNNCDFIALGGATEASIWSNYYVVDKIEDDWKSIPYGQPLGNQYLKVVNKRGYDCPDYVSGELWIGGDGVASGYLNDEELTKSKFEKLDDILWYKTGDMVRYKSNGIIEFLGRIDTQVKLNGFRIELGEVENNIKKYHRIDKAVAGVAEYNNAKHLVAVIVPETERMNNCEFVLSIDNANYNESELIKRFEDVKRFLITLYAKYKDSIISNNKTEFQHMKNILGTWEDWMKKNKIDYEKEAFYLIEKYGNITDGEKAESEVGKTLFNNINLFYDILEKKEKPQKLLEIDDLTPEYLSLIGEDTQYFLSQIVSEIKRKSEESNNPIKIAFLGARSGLASEFIINRIESNIQIGLFDNSYGMLDIAKQRFENCKLKIEYAVVENGFFDQKHLYNYDYVISVNTLHSYENPGDGITISKMLLKTCGKLFAIEYEKFDPMAMVTSAILEDGFSKDLSGRSEKNSPLLNEEDWKNYLMNSGYSRIEIIKRGKLGAEFIKAELGNQLNILEDNEFNDYIKAALPAYMIPDRFIILPWAVLSKNGKVDRNTMLKFANNVFSEEVEAYDYEGREKEISDLWGELFQLKKIDRNKSFFEIGGDSLSATRFLAKVKKIYGIDISLKEIFEMPKLSQIAELIDKNINEIGQMVEGEL